MFHPNSIPKKVAFAFFVLRQSLSGEKAVLKLSGHGIQKGDCPSQEKGQSPFLYERSLKPSRFWLDGTKAACF